MQREEREFYECTIGKPGFIPPAVESLHDEVSAILLRIAPGRVHPQTMALISVMAGRLLPKEKRKRGRPPKNRAVHAE